MIVVIKTWTPNDQYGPDELNRVETNTQHIADYLQAAGYPVTLEPLKTDRDMAGYEFGDSLSRVERNIDGLRQGFITPPGYQAPKTWSGGMGHNFQDANRLEQNLQILYDWALGVVDSFKHCGAFACGEDGGIY